MEIYVPVIFCFGFILADRLGINSSSLIISTISGLMTILLAIVAFFIKSRLARLDQDLTDLEGKMTTCQQTHILKDGKQDDEIQTHARDLVEIKTKLTGMGETLVRVEQSNTALTNDLRDYGARTNEGLTMILRFLEEERRRRNGGQQG